MQWDTRDRRSQRQMRRRIEWLLVPALLFGSDAVARSEVIERVVAVVNDDAIFLSELRRRAAPFLEQVLSGANETKRRERIDKLYDQFLKELVDEQLIEQTARKLSITVSSAEVDQAI